MVIAFEVPAVAPSDVLTANTTGVVTSETIREASAGTEIVDAIGKAVPPRAAAL